ncbi:exosortase C-terminal domain/associated protein EpsI [Novosphingobium album (ex Hu et al. 2023)]|uniref:EpsI family protein n=1 Tax=Novosphingobium album (ex Hu et al. 2023) TaxID=2930093 RepID=A0ABT0B4Q2_9SPHN|nr:exosortase C-terminal domain/associated protein EpsI [Novosphingobium album (ex Hu et al. 2023)]MCJ2180057.1 EpsI family protein [Novosphingobium album (ex Hu et al. 2023)]
MTGSVKEHSPLSPGMDRRQLVLGSLLMMGAGAAYALKPRRTALPVRAGALAAIVPERIGDYRYVSASGLVVAPRSELREATYSDVLTRVYVGLGQLPVMLLVAFGSAQDAGLSIHRPEECYPALGFDLSQVRTVALTGPVPANSKASFVTARSDERTEHVYFWVRIGSSFPASSLEQRMTIVKDNLRGEIPFGVLTRLSVIGGDADAALEAMENFNAALLRSLDAKGREMLLGHD